MSDRRTVTFNSKSLSGAELHAARWRAKQIILFVGVPGIILAGASLAFNLLFARQLGHSDTERWAWMSVAAAITLLISGLPVAIELLRRSSSALSGVAIALWCACFAFSMISAMGFSFGTRSRAAAETEASINARQALQASIARAEAELSALPQHRPVGAIQADIASTQAAIGYNCTGKLRNPRLREACAPVFDLKRELAAAQDAETLEAKIAVGRERLSGMTIYGTADAQAGTLAWMAGGLFSAETWRRLMSLFTAALVEFGAAGCLLITGKSVAALMSGDDRPAQQPVETITPTVLEPAIANVEPETAFQMWFSTCVSPSNGSRISPKDAYSHYEAWAGLNNINGLLQYHTFGRRMAEAVEATGGKLGNSGGRYYGGVTLAKLGANGMPLLDKPEQEASE
jgi:hypothetical protein